MDSLELTTIDAWIAPCALMLPRLFGVFAVVPFLAGGAISNPIRGGVIFVLAMFLSPLADAVNPSGFGGWILISSKEAFIGVMLGLGFGMFIWALQSVGDLIDFQTGSANATFFDPIGGHEGGPTGRFLGWVAIATFISVGGLLAMLQVIIDSYRLWPVGSFYPDMGKVLEQFAIRQGDTLFEWIVKLGAPAVVALLLVELGIGLVGRFVPQLNVFAFSQPVKGVVATLMLLLFMYSLYDWVLAFLRPENGALRFLKDSL
ncbi:type III secretion system export apparatus subunit SctT [Roseateles sp. NT4]|uniref:type III secretion system export apparatus subunit SctT n=1 Tax=Roseateles sp. NT4 TaxID=3453715 RepID=UPI003EEA7A9A